MTIEENSLIYESSLSSEPIGKIIGGSLSQGLETRLEPAISSEEVREGVLVSIAGKRHRFFGMVTDLKLQSADPHFSAFTADIDDRISEVLSGTSVFTTVTVKPYLALNSAEEIEPSKSLPGHFSSVYRASNEDVQIIYGKEGAQNIYIGSPLDMEETRVCLNLSKFVQRSNGVFGKSGSGKSLLTLILLAGILQKGLATNLIFDWASEYGWGNISEEGYELKGLKQIYGSRVCVLSLDNNIGGPNHRSPDYVVRIGYDEIEPEDISILAETLHITELGVQAAYSLAAHYHDDWLRTFLDPSTELEEIASKTRENVNTLDALRRRLSQLRRFDFLTEERVSGKGAVETILDYLLGNKHVVLEFGSKWNGDYAAYLLVTNLLTRRIYQRYRHLTEKALANHSEKPKPLVITIEEAHQFLSPRVASQTIFGTIAREMRKYSVTLLVVDQRPSGIDSEVLSQIGTRLVCQLSDDRDVNAVLEGAPDARGLKGLLSRLASQRQALMFGHALPMPVLLHTREYGQRLYADHAIASIDQLSRSEQLERDKKDLFG